MTAVSLAEIKDRVLLIEDDQEVRRSLTLMLRARGYALDVYESGLALLAAGYLPQADCIIVDYKMPKVDGLQLLGRLRDAGLRAPALLITGFYSDKLDQRSRRAGYSRVLEKPVTADTLAAAIAQLTRGDGVPI
ncbi:MAG: response regulator [Pseudomonadota bacterium]